MNSPPAAPQTVSILGYEDDSRTDRGALTRRLVRKTVSIEDFEGEVQKFLAAMGRIIGNLTQQVGMYQMDTITVSAEINATGKVSLFGSGGEMGGKGGMSFTFKRTSPDQSAHE